MALCHLSKRLAALESEAITLQVAAALATARHGPREAFATTVLRASPSSPHTGQLWFDLDALSDTELDDLIGPAFGDYLAQLPDDAVLTLANGSPAAVQRALADYKAWYRERH